MLMCEMAQRMEESFMKVHHFHTGLLLRPPLAEVHQCFIRLRNSEFAESGNNQGDLVKLEDCIVNGLKAERRGDYKGACAQYEEGYNLITERGWVVPSASDECHWDVLWLLVWTFSALIPLLQLKFENYDRCLRMLVNMEGCLYYGHPDMLALYQSPKVRHGGNSNGQHFPLIDWLYSTVRTVALEMGNEGLATMGIELYPEAMPTKAFLSGRLSRQHCVYGNLSKFVYWEEKKWEHMGSGDLPDHKVAEMKIQDALMRLDRVPLDKDSEEALWRETMKRGKAKFSGMDETIEFMYWKEVRNGQYAFAHEALVAAEISNLLGKASLKESEGLNFLCEKKKFIDNHDYPSALALHHRLVQAILSDGGRPKLDKAGQAHQLLDYFYCASLLHLTHYHYDGRKEDLEHAVHLCYQGLENLVMPQDLLSLQKIHRHLGVCFFELAYYETYQVPAVLEKPTRSGYYFERPSNPMTGSSDQVEEVPDIQEPNGLPTESTRVEGEACPTKTAEFILDSHGGQNLGEKKLTYWNHSFDHLMTASKISTEVLESSRTGLGDRWLTFCEDDRLTWWFLEAAAHFKIIGLDIRPSIPPGATSSRVLPSIPFFPITSPAGHLHDAFRMAERGRCRALIPQLVQGLGSLDLPQVESKNFLENRMAMGAGTVFVEYSFVYHAVPGRPLIHFFNIYVVDSKGINHSWHNGNKEHVEHLMEDIDRHLKRLKDAMSKDGTTIDLYDDLSCLYRLLIKPIENCLEGMSPLDFLVISPHGILKQVPFHILMPNKSTYLLDRYTISITPSFWILEICRQRLTTLETKAFHSPGGAAIGNPVYKKSRELPASGEEIKGISEFFPQGEVEVFQGNLATKHEFLSQAESRQGFLHIAVHGRADEWEHDKHGSTSAKNGNTSTRGALEFGDDEEESARLLTSEEIERNCAGKWQPRMVTLSACQSALGEHLGAEGLLNLPRAVLVAGSPCCIGSMWKTSDEASSVLMKELYKCMRNGMTAGHGLRAAMLYTRDQCRKKKDEHYQIWEWAPFVVWGLPTVSLPKEMLQSEDSHIS